MERMLWSNPHLIVLVRGQHDEAVLAVCKTRTDNTPLNIAAVGCTHSVQNECVPCNELADS